MRERTPFPRGAARAAARLRLLVTTGMAQRLDRRRRGARAAASSCAAPAGSRAATVELTWALILALARGTSRGGRSACGRAAGSTRSGSSWPARTLGVVGLGRLGSRVAEIGQAFEMDVVAWSQNLDAERAAAVGVAAVGKDELLRRAPTS